MTAREIAGVVTLGGTNGINSRGPLRRGLAFAMTVLSYDDAAAHLLATQPEFSVGTAIVRGIEYRVFENAPQTLVELLQTSRERHDGGQAEFIAFNDESWSFDEYCADVCALAKALRNRGIGAGSRVAIVSRNYPEFLILFLAIAAAGGVVVFLNAWWTTEELDYAIDNSGPDVIFADGPRLATILAGQAWRGRRVIGLRDGQIDGHETYDTLRAEGAGASWPDVQVGADDDFGIMYSSGTTGHPKGVVLTHRGAVNAAYTWFFQNAMVPLMFDFSDVEGPPPRRAALVLTPLFHVTASHAVFLSGMTTGTKMVLMPKWDADAALDLIQTHKITHFIGVPTQSADLMQVIKKQPEAAESLQFIASGGAKRPPSQVGELAQSFPKAFVATGWGMTETNAIGIGGYGPDYVARPGSVGRLYPPLQELMFLDADGNPVPTGEVGEMTVKSPSNMRCYLDDPDATQEVLHDGWLRTGDLGLIDEEGFITIVDRSKNIIIRGGENVACLDVEAALHTFDGVVEACAFAVPDDRLGETVGALVYLDRESQASVEVIQSYLRQRIAHFKVPDHIWFDPNPLPRGATGKLDRRVMQQSCIARLDGGKHSERSQ